MGAAGRDVGAGTPNARGACLCGAVTLVVAGPLRPVIACHCSQCRKATGNYVAATSALRSDVTISGEVTWYRSSDTARRGFCGICGSNLLWDGPGANLSIMAGALDMPTGLQLAGHIYCADRGDWYDLPATERQVPGADAALTTQVTTMGFTVAIDGPAAAGKGTISRALAEHFGFQHLDTGLLYRAVGARVEAGEDAVAAVRTLTPNDLARDDLRTPAIAAAASRIATRPEVRDALTEFQRSFARLPQGAVLDGRDIGTVICPEAQVKLYVTASPEVRAERRFAELSGKGLDVTLDGVLQDVLARDARDMGRADAPLRAAADALILDTSELDVAEAVAAAIAHVSHLRDGAR